MTGWLASIFMVIVAANYGYNPLPCQGSGVGLYDPSATGLVMVAVKHAHLEYHTVGARFLAVEIPCEWIWVRTGAP